MKTENKSDANKYNNRPSLLVGVIYLHKNCYRDKKLNIWKLIFYALASSLCWILLGHVLVTSLGNYIKCDTSRIMSSYITGNTCRISSYKNVKLVGCCQVILNVTLLGWYQVI